ncbi:T9SS type A sorting domain-containing protein [Taibaiella soli]|uniref:Secretion system C-terminal sorting domain-containing protein n=1 Tax=Taibaiella soli TaxID=1649169 RepID=A0A2W2BEY7_9BACT|nr:T9SS type A sorting domain-containing protein [Taibaiella soli]PZF74457.1 hypothetical protein DN068_02430 [Taibaiella soli]
MKKYLFIPVGLLACMQADAQTPVLNLHTNVQMVTSGAVHVVVTNGSTNIESGSTINISSGSLTMHSLITGIGGFSSAGTGDLKMLLTNVNGNIGTLNLAGSNTIKSLSVSLTGTNSPSITLGSDLTVTNNVTFTSGYIMLGNHNLTVASSASVTGGNSTAYAVTNGTGRFTIQNVGTGGKTGLTIWPIGAVVGSYTPMGLTNSGTADNFSVGVLGGVYSSYSNDVPSSAPLTTNAVNRTWIISEGTPGGSNVALTVQWNTAEELSGFTRSACYLSHYSNATNSWTPGATSSASGANPYIKTLSGITSFSPFGIGSGVSPLPLDLVAFTGKMTGEDAMINWTTMNESNVRDFVLERSVSGSDFTAISTMKPLATADLQKQYQYRDANITTLNAPQVFYRLKIEDNNGEYKYSDVVALNVDRTNQPAVAIVPNPISGNVLTLNTSGSTKGNATVKIVDLTGRVQLATTITEQDFQSSKISFDVANLIPGFYILQVESNDWKQSLKFSKQ